MCVKGKDVLQVFKNGEIIEEIVVTGKAVFPRSFEKGYYELSLKNDGSIVEFAVNKAQISYSLEGNIIKVNADPCDPNSEILYLDFRKSGKDVASLAKFEILSEEEKTTGAIERIVPRTAENFKVYFKNKYGVWVHRMAPII